MEKGVLPDDWIISQDASELVMVVIVHGTVRRVVFRTSWIIFVVPRSG